MPGPGDGGPHRTTRAPTPKTMPASCCSTRCSHSTTSSTGFCIIANARITAGRGSARPLSVRLRQDPVPRARARARAVAGASPTSAPAPDVAVQPDARKSSRPACERSRSASPPATSIRPCCRSASRPTSTADPFTVYRALRHVNPSPYMYFMRMGGAGDRRLVAGDARARRGPARRDAPDRRHAPARHATTKRISGSAEELKRNEKERAEHVMLVDLGRNDLGRVCEYGSGPGAAVHGARALLARHAPGVDGRRPAGRGPRPPRCAGRLLSGRHGVRRAEDPRDADPVGARADAPRDLRRRRRLPRLRRQPGLLHRDSHDHHPRRRAPTCRPAPASSPTRTRRPSTRRRATRRGRMLQALAMAEAGL